MIWDIFPLSSSLKLIRSVECWVCNIDIVKQNINVIRSAHSASLSCMSPLYNSQILSKNPHHWFMKKTNMEQWRGQCIIVPECTALIILSASTICFGWGVGFFMGSSGHNTMSWKGFLLGIKEHFLPWKDMQENWKLVNGQTFKPLRRSAQSVHAIHIVL